MERDTSIHFYTTDECGERLKKQAEKANKSLSTYCHQVVSEHLDDKQEERQNRRYSVDQQIELALDQFCDETSTLLSTFQSETVTRLEHMQRLRTIYVMAVWRLLKQDYSPSEQKAAVKRSLDHVGCNVADDPELRPLLTSDQRTFEESSKPTSSVHPADKKGEDSE